jgi:hypothetical protein
MELLVSIHIEPGIYSYLRIFLCWPFHKVDPSAIQGVLQEQILFPSAVWKPVYFARAAICTREPGYNDGTSYISTDSLRY